MFSTSQFLSSLKHKLSLHNLVIINAAVLWFYNILISVSINGIIVGNSNILLNHQLSSEIITLIESSKEYCFLITPYYKPWQLLNRALEKAAANEKKIIFIFRDREVKKEILEDLNKKGFDIHLVEKLHTKLYLNEKTVIVTSMNLYDASKENNYEVGYKINGTYESKQFRTEVIEKDILGTKPRFSLPGRYAVQLKASTDDKTKSTQSIKGKDAGYCLRCRAEIQYDFNRPYCLECYKSWSKNNYPTKEKYCHSCGAHFLSSYEQPACKKCS